MLTYYMVSKLFVNFTIELTGYEELQTITVWKVVTVEESYQLNYKR